MAKLVEMNSSIMGFKVRWNCEEEELWMDPARKVICRGPQGPLPCLVGWSLQLADVPANFHLLQENVFLRFLASFKSKQVDYQFVEGIRQSYVIEDASEKCIQPTVVSTLTQTCIAVANNILQSDNGSLSERKLLENGMTR